jgi:hypothetical protein
MLVVAFSLMPVLVMLFYRHPMFLLYLFLITNEIFEVFDPDYSFRTGGFFLLPTDAVYFFTITTLGLCALLRPGKTAAALKENIFLTMFLAVVVIYVVLYTPVYGQRAIGEARKLYFIFLIPLLAAVAIKTPADLRRFLVTIVWVSAGLAIIGFGKAVATGTIIRPNSAHVALSLALAAFLMLIHRINRIVLVGPILDKVLLWLFFAAAITAGHRTVWLAIGSGLLLAFWLYGRKQAVIAKLLLVVFTTIAAMGMGIALFPETGARLGTYFQGILDPQADSNASWRIEGWERNLNRLTQDGNLLFGEGFGTYYGRGYEDVLLPSPHSGYIELMLKFGLSGLLLYSLLVFKFLRKALAARKKLGPGPMRAWLETSILIFCAAHAFSSGYSFDPMMLIFFAVGNSAQRLSTVVPSSSSDPSRAQHQRTESLKRSYPFRGLSDREPNALRGKFEIRHPTCN